PDSDAPLQYGDLDSFRPHMNIEFGADDAQERVPGIDVEGSFRIALHMEECLAAGESDLSSGPAERDLYLRASTQSHLAAVSQPDVTQLRLGCFELLTTVWNRESMRKKDPPEDGGNQNGCQRIASRSGANGPQTRGERRWRGFIEQVAQ